MQEQKGLMAYKGLPRFTFCGRIKEPLPIQEEPFLSSSVVRADGC